jgi:hypothetical protein
VQSLRFGPQAGAVELLAVEPLSEAPTPEASLEAGRERLLVHPLAFRDKVLFSTAERTWLGFIASLQACEPLLAEVTHEGRPVPVVTPLVPVTWDHDGQTEPVAVHLLLGLKRQANAPTTYADIPPPKPQPASLQPWLWILATFAGMTALSLALDHWWSRWAAEAVTIGLVSGGLVAGVLQHLVFSRVQAPDVAAADVAGYWDTVKALASRQIATSALPGEWTVTAIPAGCIPRRDWSWEIGALVVVVITGVLLRWPPPGA